MTTTTNELKCVECDSDAIGTYEGEPLCQMHASLKASDVWPDDDAQ